MRFCTNCGEGIDDKAQMCPKCGAPVLGQGNQIPLQMVPPQDGAQQTGQIPGGTTQQGMGQGIYQQPQMYPAFDPTDHTKDMDPSDIVENKILAVAIYVFSVVGMIIALLAARDSKFVGFHLREAIRLAVLDTIVGIVAVVLCWTFIVPIAACVFACVLFVVRIIGFVNACKGKAKELPIIHSFKFLN
ncbi:zinc-ribbon domain-containing protein [Butyrivibrio sp. AE3004]|uniref:zinc-ribbon domain-containing protein n=1 Tax=Butyrivibrio sp. AE3004 TaxID=1506994 RepID=UPI0004945D4B|nr:zinc-ribbon domain-containing protein [Butyrivibrio sp. AE3004]